MNAPLRKFTFAEMREAFLRWRGVEVACPKCRGAGAYRRSDGVEWKPGAWDTCDECWGTGDADRQGVDLRAQRETERGRILTESATLFAKRCGIDFSSLRPGILALSEELDALGRRRHYPAPWFHLICDNLANLLRDLLESKT